MKLLDILYEGVHDKSILKCLFMAGGPGSGKSWVIGDIFGLPTGSTLTGTGLKVVNPDNAFTALLKKNGINPTELAKIQSENPEFYYSVIDSGNPDKPGLREKAVALNKKARNFYFAGRLGMIVDGTGAFPEFLEKRKLEAEAWGYDTGMIFVNTDLEVALERNRNRDRTLPEAKVEEMWRKSQQNLQEYRTMFGNNLWIVDNSSSKPVDAEVKRQINNFIKRPVANPIGKEWLKQSVIVNKHI